LKFITGFKSVNIILREKYYGLANNVIFGVKEVLKTIRMIIALEHCFHWKPINMIPQIFKKPEFG
jgi:hypothetical protein